MQTCSCEDWLSPLELSLWSLGVVSLMYWAWSAVRSVMKLCTRSASVKTCHEAQVQQSQSTAAQHIVHHFGANMTPVVQPRDAVMEAHIAGGMTATVQVEDTVMHRGSVPEALPEAVYAVPDARRSYHLSSTCSHLKGATHNVVKYSLCKDCVKKQRRLQRTLD